jgi:hypothetical protein
MSVRFDDPNLVSCGGLAAVQALATRCGLARLLTDRLRIAARGGVNATAKVLALVAGMVAGADSIDDMDLLRHGGMGRLFTDVRAPSTLGAFLRVFTFGHVRQLDAVAAALLPRLVGCQNQHLQHPVLHQRRRGRLAGFGAPNPRRSRRRTGARDALYPSRDALCGACPLSSGSA